MNTLLALALHAPEVPEWFQPEIPPEPPKPVAPAAYNTELSDAEFDAYSAAADLLDADPNHPVEDHWRQRWQALSDYEARERAWEIETSHWDEHQRFFLWRRYFAEHLSEVMR